MATLTLTGLVIRSLQEIRDDLDATCRTLFGNSIDLSDASVMGQYNGIVAERLALLEELLQAVVASSDPDAATGAALDALCALTGTVRNPAAPSEVTLTLTGDPTTIVLTGSRAAVEVTGDEFETTADATITLLTSWAITTAYTLGNRRTNAGNAYEVITAGTSAGSGGPTTEAADITDGTVHWRFLGEGTAAIDVAAESSVDDAIVAASGTLTEIVTPVSGWLGVINLLDADLGNLVETDEDLRLRRDLELARAGTATLDAIRADLLEVDDVTSVRVFHNPTDATDVDGLPPHSVEVLIQGGDDQAIADQLLDSVAAGIATFGTTTETAADDEGISHDVSFSRPDEIEIYVDITVQVDPLFFPLGGDDLVVDAVVAAGDDYATGRDVRASAVGASSFAVAGVLGAPTVLIDDAPAPAGSADVAIGLRELATFDSSRVAVTIVEVTP